MPQVAIAIATGHCHFKELPLSKGILKEVYTIKIIMIVIIILLSCYYAKVDTRHVGMAPVQRCLKRFIKYIIVEKLLLPLNFQFDRNY